MIRHQLFSLVIFMCCSAQTAYPAKESPTLPCPLTDMTNNPGDSVIFTNRASVEHWLKKNKVPVLGLGIIENSQLQQVSLFGEIAPGIPAPRNTIFNVASLAKPVAALVALKLVSAGKWNLDKPLDAYWIDPDIATDPRHRKLTTRLVLSHQTGFPNWRRMRSDQKLGFDFEPGSAYQYSGEGFEYLRKALEYKFGKSLQTLAKELLFDPLNMPDTRFIWNQQLDTTRLASGYDSEGKPYLTVRHTAPNAADDLLTTIDDYGHFLVNLMQGGGLNPKLVDDMVLPQVASSKGKHFALGFERYELENGNYALSHGGSDEGVRCIVFLLPKTGKGLMIFTNSDEGVNLYASLISHYLGQDGQRIIDIEMK